MKQFLETNTITYNLMSFTGFKSILIFSLLLDGPKSYDEIIEYLGNHEYLHETVSTDSVRIYINSLKEIGCEVLKKRYDGVTKYSITDHPFKLKLKDKQVKDIIKIYKVLSDKLDISDLVALQHFFKKISKYVDNQTLKNKLSNISPINNINEALLHDLMTGVEHNAEITVFYNSAHSGKKNITIAADRLYIENGKLYISGYNTEYENYSSFLVSKIINIIDINTQTKTINVPEITVGYQYIKDNNEDFKLLENEKLINSEGNKQIIEITSKNKFEIFQRIMYNSPKCTVLYPEDFRQYIIFNLKKMKEGYIGR